MTVRRLINLIDQILDGGTGQVRNDTVQTQTTPDTVFLEDAVVQSVNALSGADVSIRGKVIGAGQNTDEPLETGQVVLVSQIKGGSYTIHGTLKG